MSLTKTIRAKVFHPTNIKRERLDWLYRNWGQSGYKMHDNMAIRYPTKRVLNQWSIVKPNSLYQYPNSDIAQWWLRLPITKGELRNYPLRMAPEHEDMLADPNIKLCNSELIKRHGEFYIHLTVQREVSPPLTPNGKVLAVDIGERVIATSVVWDGSRVREPRFRARVVRGVRRHHAWLRRRLQERGHFRTLARMGRKESRRVMDELHKASREIVDQAKEHGAAIAIGDLSGIRDRDIRGRRFRRLIHAWPYAQLCSLVRYKAAWDGVPVVLVNEAYTSVQCHVCNSTGKRPSQGLFLCPNCGEYNADLNGATNIAKRVFSYMEEVGATGTWPEGGQRHFEAPPDQSVIGSLLEPIASARIA